MPRLPGFLLLASLLFAPLHAAEYYERYDLSPRPQGLDLGAQPLSYPAGMISAVMQRDRIMRTQLAKLGQPLNTYAFRDGSGILRFFGKRRLEAALLGDMPTIRAAIEQDIWIAGLVKISASSVVSRTEGMVEQLAGKRVGYVEGSTAHHTLLQALNSAGLSEDAVTLLPMRLDEMPDALAEAKISAFAGWEPAASVALAASRDNRVVFRGASSSYLVIDRAFEQAHPQATREMLAGFVRAIEWMRRSRRNAEQAARWVAVDGQPLAARPPQVTIDQAVDIAHREILDVPSAPVITASTAGARPLANEFNFLRRIGKIPADSSFEQISSAFHYAGLLEVMRNRQRYRLDSFDYGN